MGTARRHPLAELLAVATVALTTTVCSEAGTGPEPEPAPSLQLELRVQPHDILTGASFDSTLVVAATNADGELLSGVREDVALTLTVEAGTAVLTGTTSVPLSDGLASFPSLGATGSTVSARITASWQDLSTESQVFSVVTEPDEVDIPASADPSVEGAILVDGEIGGVGQNDIELHSAGGLEPVGVVRSGTSRNEVIAFVPGSAPTVVPAPWTLGIDTVEVEVRDVQAIPMTIWVVYGPFDDAAAEITAEVSATNQLFADQFAGIRLEADLVDVTDAPEEYLDPDLTPREFGMDALGYFPDRINVYAVRNIMFSTEDVVIGFAEIGGNMMLMSKLGWSHRTLPHEVGHILGLEHVNNLETFPAENLMQAGGSPDRSQLTEGQTFRMQYDRKSAMHSVLGVVPVEETRGCQSGYDFYSAGCPHEDLSLFPEAAPVALSAPIDPLEQYLTWDCGVSAPPRPDVGTDVWERLVTQGVPGWDGPTAELARMRALTAWARTDPASAHGTLEVLSSGPEGPLRALARRLSSRAR